MNDNNTGRIPNLLRPYSLQFVKKGHGVVIIYVLLLSLGVYTEVVDTKIFM